MTHVTCRLTAKNRHQFRNPTLGNRVWATFTFLRAISLRVAVPKTQIAPTPLHHPSSSIRIVLLDIKAGIRNVSESVYQRGDWHGSAGCSCSVPQLSSTSYHAPRHGGTSPGIDSSSLLAPPVYYAQQGICICRASVRPSVCLSQQGPTTANPLLQVCCCEPGRREISIARHGAQQRDVRMRTAPRCQRT